MEDSSEPLEKATAPTSPAANATDTTESGGTGGNPNMPTAIQFAAPNLPSRRNTMTSISARDEISPPNSPRGIYPPLFPRKTSFPPPVIIEEEKISSSKEQDTKRNVDITEHFLSPDKVADQYLTSINTDKPNDSLGLTTEQAENLLKEHGRNVITPPKKRHPLLKFLDCLTSLFNLLLIFAGILEYILLAIDYKANFQNTYLGAILIAVAFLNAFIEYYQQAKSQALLDSFLKLIPAKCTCIRSGRLIQMDAAELVPGDVVFVKMGDKCPADLFVFGGTDCKVDNSSLTGESEPQERGKENSCCSSRNPLEATNIMFNSTLVVSGEAYGIVIRTGDSTVLGQIANMTAGEEKARSPLAHEIDNFVKIIASIAIITASVFFGIAFPLNNNNVSLALNFAIGIFVAWVPEGLPATVTMLLTIAAKRMAAQNVLVKDLQGVETLGAITLLATDKTGTLTRNQMTATNVWTCGELYDAVHGHLSAVSLHNNEEGEEDEAEQRFATVDKPGVKDILHISALCSRAKFNRMDVPIKERQILGDATESGLVRYAAEMLGHEFEELQETYPKLFELPFNSDTKWHMSIHKKAHPNGGLTLFIKGAPERVLKLCNRILTGYDNNELQYEALDESWRTKYDETYEYMAGLGHRVLAFAELPLPGNEYPDDYVFDKKAQNYPLENLVFVGLASLQDPPKHGVREAIGRCRAAGIKVIMVTGDHPLTAEAIGRKINLIIGDTKAEAAKRLNIPIEEVGEREYDAAVVHGEQIDTLSDQEWDTILMKDEIIFARTSPKHKLEIVRRAQSMGHIVGVTGDGVNDSPALKKADLGIAMNISGSDVSKEAASMILLDDNFASTVRGIEEGRLIFANLKKSIQYTISHSTPEVIPNLLYVIVPIPLPLSAILILVIDLGFELIAALSFAWDPPETEEGLMKLPPRKPVTTNSIEIFRRQKLREQRAHFDEETGTVTTPEINKKSCGICSKLIHRIRLLFNKQVWRDRFANTGSEVLVDTPLLSWAYLEIGLLEAIGCLTAFFIVLYKHGITPYDARIMQKGSGSPTFYFTDHAVTYKNINARQQVDILAEAQSVYYWSIMTLQMFNLFACKTRLTIPIGKYVFKNRVSFYSILGGAALGALVIYVPGVGVVFGTSRHLSPLYWLVSMGFGVVLLAYACLRGWLSRIARPVKWNPEVMGLQMFPTIRTVRTQSMGRA